MQQLKTFIFTILSGVILFSTTFAIDLDSVTVLPYCQKTATLCIFNNVTSIAPNTFVNHTALTRLYISSSPNFTYLGTGIFNGLGPKLTELHISNNGLTQIASGAFAGLGKLTLLNLYNNQISSLDTGSLYGLTGLIDLWLHANQISSLPVGVFSQLIRLDNLTLSTNQISSLPVGVFSGLFSSSTGTNRQLDLAGNKLTEIISGVFLGANKIKTLKLSSNVINSIQSGSFLPLTGLTTLELNYNSINRNLLDAYTLNLFNTVSPSWSSTQILSGCMNPLSSNYDPVATRDDGSCDTETYLNATNILVRCSTSATSCDLSNLSIVSIAPDTFVNHSNLQNLYLGGNKIASLYSGVFNGLSSLTLLSLYYNSGFTTLPSNTFVGLSNLQQLYLSSCSISSLEDGVFNGLSNLSYLSMDGNFITHISQYLFNGLHNLTDLGLGNNQISTIDANAFSGLGLLTNLNLYGNQLSTLSSGIFLGLSGLQYLSLQTNTISSVDVNAFQGLNSLTTLHINYNEISSLPSGVFSSLSSLTQLNLQNNKLTGLNHGILQGLNNLQNIDFQYNDIGYVQAGVFGDAPGLQTISLVDNDITTLEIGAFSGLQNISTIYLSNNLLTGLVANQFNGIGSIGSIYLQNNQIASIESGTFAGLSTLSSLWLADNKLSTLPPMGFVGLDSLTYLDIGGNAITDLKTDGFYGLRSLSSLNLSSFGINQIYEGAFRGLSGLNYLYLENNNLQSIVSGAFEGLDNLVYLSIDNNKNLTNIYRDSFRGLSSLNTLSLRYGKIISVQSGTFDLIHPRGLYLDRNCIDTEDQDFLAYMSTLSVSYSNQLVCHERSYTPATTTTNKVVGFINFIGGPASSRATLNANNTGLVHEWTENGEYGISINQLNDPGYLSAWKYRRESVVTGSVTWIVQDQTSPIGTITYSPDVSTSSGVVATLHLNETGTVLNNGGSFNYVFTGNGSFEFIFSDIAGNTGSSVATVTWIKTSGGGGGGSKIEKDICPDGDLSLSLYDNTCKAPYKAPTDTTGNVLDNQPTPSVINQDIVDAYKWAFIKGITTQQSIEKARVQDPLTRAEMAKMIVAYALKSKLKTNTNTLDKSFSDLNGQTNEMKQYIADAYRLGLMGIGSDSFRPNEFVTRAEFTTVLARLLYGDTESMEGIFYYSKPMELLYTNGIIKNVDPYLVEARGYVMLMMMRASVQKTS